MMMMIYDGLHVTGEKAVDRPKSSQKLINV